MESLIKSINDKLDDQTGYGLTGWLSPSGIFTPCKYHEHSVLAQKIIAKQSYNRQYKFIAEDQLRMFNWVSMTSSKDLSSYIFIPTLPFYFTDEQLNWLYNNYIKLDGKQRAYLNEFGELAGWDRTKLKCE